MSHGLMSHCVPSRASPVYPVYTFGGSTFECQVTGTICKMNSTYWICGDMVWTIKEMMPVTLKRIQIPVVSEFAFEIHSEELGSNLPSSLDIEFSSYFGLGHRDGRTKGNFTTCISCFQNYAEIVNHFEIKRLSIFWTRKGSRLYWCI